MAAGAKLLIVVNDGVGVLNEWVGESPIPVATVHRDAGALLIALAKTGMVPLRAKQVPYTSFIYDLTRNYPGQRAEPGADLQAEPERPGPDQRELLRRQGRGGRRLPLRHDLHAVDRLLEREWYPGTRVEWVTPDLVWHEGHGTSGDWTDNSNRNTFAKGSTTTLNWFAPAIRPAFTRAFAVQNGRYRDFMTINVQAWSSSGNDGLEHGGNLPWGRCPPT